MLTGHTFKGYLPGGASGGILPASMADLPLDFGTLEKYGCFVGSHAVVILSDKDDMKAVALNLMRFFEDESCGQCTPCRVGTEKAVKLMATGPWDEALLNELSDAMRDASICGLGPGGAEPAALRLQVFPRGPGASRWGLVMMQASGMPPLRCAVEGSMKRSARVRSAQTALDGQKPSTRSGNLHLDEREVDIRDGETIFRAARRDRHQAAASVLFARSPAIARTAIAASAWWRSRASACWRRAASARPRPA